MAKLLISQILLENDAELLPFLRQWLGKVSEDVSESDIHNAHFDVKVAGEKIDLHFRDNESAVNTSAPPDATVCNILYKGRIELSYTVK